MTSSSAFKTYAVVPDVNVWLTVARKLGPFTLEDVNEAIKDGRSHWDKPDVFCFLGSLLDAWPGGIPVQIWSGEHIIECALRKASQPQRGGARPEDRGLGWNSSEVECIADLIGALVNSTNGDFVPLSGAYCHPPLDYEDGNVAQITRNAAFDQASCKRICVTYDRDFVAKMRGNPFITVEEPFTWCNRRMTEDRVLKMGNMLPHAD